MAKDDPYCEFHSDTQLIPDTFGNWYCPDCEHESYERGQRLDKYRREPCPHTGRTRRDCDCVCPDCGKGRHKSLKVERCHCATNGNNPVPAKQRPES